MKPRSQALPGLTSPRRATLHSSEPPYNNTQHRDQRPCIRQPAGHARRAGLPTLHYAGANERCAPDGFVWSGLLARHTDHPNSDMRHSDPSHFVPLSASVFVLSLYCQVRIGLLTFTGLLSYKATELTLRPSKEGEHHRERS